MNDERPPFCNVRPATILIKYSELGEWESMFQLRLVEYLDMLAAATSCEPKDGGEAERKVTYGAQPAR